MKMINFGSDAEILPSPNARNSSVYKILVPHVDEIVDADELQIQKNAVRPRVIRGVIVA